MSDLPTSWIQAPIRSVIKLQYGKGLPKRKRDSSGSVPVYGSAGVVGAHSSALVDGPALVIGRKGNVGSTYLSPGPCWPIDTVYFARIPQGLSPKYLAYQLQSMRLNELDSSTAIPSLRRESLEAELVALAPITEQERIVTAIEEQFSRLDAGVAALGRARQSLKQMRAAVLQAAIFGEPAPGTAALAVSDSREDSDSLSELPSGWAWRSLNDVCESVTDGDHQPPPKADQGIPFLVIGNVRNGLVDFADCRHVPPTYYRALQPTRRPRMGDVLYTLVGSFGIPVLVTDDRPFCVQRHIGILRPSTAIQPAYLAAALASRQALSQARDVATGTAQLTVPLSGLRRMMIPVPPFDEQGAIVTDLNRFEVVAQRVEEALTGLVKRAAGLRSSVLTAAASGRLVSQDPSDEPASTLLERIAAENASSNGRTPGRARNRRRGEVTA